MDQIVSHQPDIADREFLQVLADEWQRGHSTLENYVLVWFIYFILLGRLDKKFSPIQSWLIRALFLTLIVMGIPLIITAATSQWNIAPFWKWAIVVLGFILISLNYPIYKRASTDVGALYRTIQDDVGIKKMISWDLRWFSLGKSFPAGVLFAVVALILLLYAQKSREGVTIPIGTFALYFVLAYQVGENTFNSILMCFEAFSWSVYRFDLYTISPIETIALQRTLRGYDQVAFYNSIFMTLFIAGLALLLSGTTYLTNVFLLCLLIIAYLVIGLLFLLPRIAIQQIVRSAKVHSLLPLQNKVNTLYENYVGLNAQEYEELKRMEEMYRKIQGSSDTLLPFASFGKVFGNLLLPTITFILAVSAEAYLGFLLDRIFR